MALEIEHKFLVNSSAYRSLAKPVLYRQGYLVVLSDKIVRVRTAGTKAYITIKAKVSVLTRKEYEYEIPLADAETMLNEMCMGPLIEKYRYKIFYEGFVWEVDEFLGDNNGLVVAEIEVKSENQDFPIPLWVDTEVTGDPRYLNSNLSKKPFNTWNK
ncbi:MAG: CYTH domain-containing protein [Lentimicrobium sp.]|nr:CYTH domain-containing protein [Lentimicrobium sp.]HPG34240.1 CYTH domain-containing protein [Lentimicrobium sp.]